MNNVLLLLLCVLQFNEDNLVLAERLLDLSAGRKASVAKPDSVSLQCETERPTILILLRHPACLRSFRNEIQAVSLLALLLCFCHIAIFV